MTLTHIGPKPYYERGGATLYLGDARELLPLLNADVMVTDPPYGIAFASGHKGPFHGQRIHGDRDTSVRDVILGLWSDQPALVFGSWKVERPARTRALLVWDKEDYGGGLGDLRIPWKNSHEFIFVLGHGFVGHRGRGVLHSETMVTWASRGRVHPNQKPIGLLRQLLEKCPQGTIIDPFAGSGSTLIAAAGVGRESIGIEIEERYCEIAARRLDALFESDVDLAA